MKLCSLQSAHSQIVCLLVELIRARVLPQVVRALLVVVGAGDGGGRQPRRVRGKVARAVPAIYGVYEITVVLQYIHDIAILEKSPCLDIF